MISARTTFGSAFLAIVGAGLALVVHAGFVGPAPTVAPLPCVGNVCTGSMVVGGQTVNYAYTEHVAPGGELRVRLNGGVYNTSGLVSYIAYNLPSFSTWDKFANPNNGAVFLPVEDVNPGRTAYERSDNDGCTGCIVDQVMTVDFSALPTGAYDFDLSVIQHGDTGGRTLRFYVDAGAPANGNESSVWAALSGMDFPCADTVDNDLDYGGDCADAQCSGSVGNVGSGAMCEQPEATCNDEFDNDADGRPDCLDPDCDGRVGQPGGTALCQYGNETGLASCGDNFDNDADSWPDCVDNAFNAPAGGNVNTICWKKPAFGCPATEISCIDGIDNDKDQSYSDDWDSAPLTGRDCTDYDCAGNANCPANEHLTSPLSGSLDAPLQCFNMASGVPVDDDLDHLANCADPDCLGVVNTSNPTQVCYDKEFDFGQRYQYCGNAFDDDGDGPMDCSDSDCSRKFGNCGPCPSREDFTYDSCADVSGATPKDNDSDVVANCADPDCAGNFGSLGNAAMCGAAENTNVMCGDGFDNDVDAAIDCADASCAGLLGPSNQTCQPAGETSCAEGADNDGDGLIDCADPNCWTGGSCAMKNWTDAACIVVPSLPSTLWFTSNNPTISAITRARLHAGDTDVIQLQGSGTYSSVTVIVGDNTDPSDYYPYADPVSCVLIDTLTGLPAARFDISVIAGHAIQIYNTAGPDIAGFDITLTCPTPAIPAVTRTYPLSLSALKEPGGVPEYGDLGMSTTLHESTLPTVTTIEVEGMAGGTVRVPYSYAPGVNERRFRIVPNDPGGVAPASSGICACELTMSSTVYPTGPNCVTQSFAFQSDVTLVVQGAAEDGSGNESTPFGSAPLQFNVIPTLFDELEITPSKPFFRASAMTMGAYAEFLTALNDTFAPPFAPGTCEVVIRDAAGTVVNGAPAVPLTFAGMWIGNSISCEASNVTLPTLPDGTYSVALKVRDRDADTVESNRQAMYICNSVPGPSDAEPSNGCQYADFDFDGAAEGLFSKMPPATFEYASTPYACDNCVGLANALQTDVNANGIGDECEPSDQYGRCEIDRDIVCSWDSDDAAHGCPDGVLCCPGPSIGEDPPGSGLHKDPQLCLDAWGVCSTGGQICFEDSQCTDVSNPAAPVAGFGICQDGITACKRDTDCASLPDTPLCTDANICDNLLFPWLETRQGSLFSKKRITAPEAPPQDQYNATFCIVAKDLILNFTSAQCGTSIDPAVKFERPKQSNAYSTVLGKLDLSGLRTGKYGQVIDVPSGQLDATLNSYANRLGGRVFRVTGDATVSAHTIMNDADGGAGTVLIDGGDLTIVGDIGYDVSSVATLDRLASIGWVVLPTSGGTKGNVYIDGSVTTISGAFYVGGDDGFWTVAPPATDSEFPLTVNGLAVAKSFHFSRSFKSVDRGSEQFIYDGRAVANPPPGFADVTKSLPLFTDSLPQ